MRTKTRAALFRQLNNLKQKSTNPGPVSYFFNEGMHRQSFP